MLYGSKAGQVVTLTFKSQTVSSFSSRPNLNWTCALQATCQTKTKKLRSSKRFSLPKNKKIWPKKKKKIHKNKNISQCKNKTKTKWASQLTECRCWKRCYMIKINAQMACRTVPILCTTHLPPLQPVTGLPEVWHSWIKNKRASLEASEHVSVWTRHPHTKTCPAEYFPLLLFGRGC